MGTLGAPLGAPLGDAVIQQVFTELAVRGVLHRGLTAACYRRHLCPRSTVVLCEKRASVISANTHYMVGAGLGAWLPHLILTATSEVGAMRSLFQK